MPTTETPFLHFWRALDAELDQLEFPQATGRQVNAAWRAYQQGTPLATLAMDISLAQFYRPASHNRNAGKSL